MRRTLLSLLAATTLAAGVPAIASAQSWQPMNQRHYQLDQRIDVGVRNGQLSASEAARLRTEFDGILRLETQYRANGLTNAEMADLDRRYDLLADRVRYDRRDDERANGYGRDRDYDRDYARNYDRDWDDRGWREWDDRGWRDVNQMQARLDQRIDVGIRNRSLTQAEATRLRADFRTIVNLESQYRRNGLTANERADLSRRLDMLDERVRIATRDSDGRWANLNQRQAQFNQRLNTAVRDRRLTQTQANRLRTDFQSIARLEQQYRRGGLSANERADLDMRFDRLETTFRASINANQYGYGYGQAPNLFDYLFGLTR